MSVFLFAKCKFLLCSNSGVVDLANLFGTPAAITNIAPMSHCPMGISRNVCIHKHYISVGKQLYYPDIFNGVFERLQSSDEFKNHDITLRDNSPDEIRDLVRDMFNLLHNNQKFLRETRNIQSHISRFSTKEDFNNGVNALISPSFLKKYIKAS